MRIPRIYSSRPLQSGLELALEEGAARHVSRVLRMRAGDELVLFDGSGGEYPAVITSVARSAVTARADEFVAREAESPLGIHLGIGLSRGERLELVVQKATELGVAAITPLFTGRAGVRIDGDRLQRKGEHLRQVAISACEQCGRNRLPAVQDPTSLAHWLGETRADRRFVLHHRAEPLPAQTTAPTRVALLIGPEGGLTDGEIEQAQQAGYQPLSLGPRVLRTETAPLAAIAILQARWGDMSL